MRWAIVISPVLVAGLLTGSAAAVDVLYAFDADPIAGPVTDWMGDDGRQDASLVSYPIEITGLNPAVGAQSLLFGDTPAIAVLPIPGTSDMGTQVTMGAHLKQVPAGTRRLFSAFNAASWTNQLVIDFDPDGQIGTVNAAIRFLYGSTAVTVPTASVTAWNSSDTVHHIAVTWNDGEVVIYFDGVPKANGGSPGGGSLVLALGNLQLGEDYGGNNSQINEPLRGIVDDVFVVREVLSPAEISSIAANGAAAVLGAPSNAGDVLYTAEDDHGYLVTDKLSDIGAEDGTLPWPGPAFNDYDPLTGSQSLKFMEAAVVEIPGTSDLGSAVTLAAHLADVAAGQRRLFSAFDSTSGGAGQLVVDFDSDGNLADLGFGLRFLYNGVSLTVPTASLGNWSAENGDTTVHHIACTWNNGVVRIFFDGGQVASDSTSFPAGNLTLAVGNLQIGEDYWPTRQANEPLLGNIDDVVVVRRILTDQQIASMAANGAAAVLAGPDAPGDVLYTMEGDSGDIITDKLSASGAQNARIFRSKGPMVDGSDPIFGTDSLLMTPMPNFNGFIIPGTQWLGQQVTLAAHVRNVHYGIRRLFSSYDSGNTTPDKLLIDFDPDGRIRAEANEAIRFLYDGLEVVVPTGTPGLPSNWSFEAGNTDTHHMAFTWNDGIVKVYFDGAMLAAGGSVGRGSIYSMMGNIRFGENLPPSSPSYPIAAPLGEVDDVLVLGRVLSDQEIADLAAQGAVAFFDIEPPVKYPDLDGDGDVDGDDLLVLTGCATGPEMGPPTTSCEKADLDDDDDVDQVDFALWQRCITADGAPYESDCVR